MNDKEIEQKIAEVGVNMNAVPYDGILLIAEVCHEANRAICESFNDLSQLSWDNAPQWQKESATAGVKFRLENPKSTPKQLHQNWMKQKLEDGWVYGIVKNEKLKTHPCLVDYKQLTPDQTVKDMVFGAIVDSVSTYGECKPIDKNKPIEIEFLAGLAKFKVELITRVCYESEKAVRHAFNDFSMSNWDDAQDKQKSTMLNKVLHHLNATMPTSFSDTLTPLYQVKNSVFCAIVDTMNKQLSHQLIEAIEELMAALYYQSWQVPNTTCTVVVSTLPSKRVLTIGQCTAAKTPEESYDIALQQCIDASRKKLMRIVS